MEENAGRAKESK